MIGQPHLSRKSLMSLKLGKRDRTALDGMSGKGVNLAPKQTADTSGRTDKVGSARAERMFG
jgi:hypothetical protein